MTYSKKEKETLAKLLYVRKYRWSLHARPKQVLPLGNWVTWAIIAGRGFGKTRTGTETVRQWKENNPIMILAGATAGDLRDILIEGESGILNISPKYDRPTYQPSKSRLVWNNGAMALLRSADEPDRFRGLQCYKAWCDELAAWRYPEAYDQLMFGLRLGDKPQCIVTTTPRPTKMIRALMKDPTTYVTTGTSYENRDNLSPVFYNQIIKKYEGTRLGRQELNAELLEDIEGAMWSSKMIETDRVKEAPELKEIIIAIDPAVTSNKNSDETGIVAVGKGIDNDFYILNDYSGIFSPKSWAQRAINNYNQLEANKIIAEVNNGGDLVETVIHDIDNTIAYKSVHASRGKATRAEPVVSLYEQHRVHHVGSLPKLEDQMVTWAPNTGEKSPDRVDALVWGVTYLNSYQESWFS